MEGTVYGARVGDVDRFGVNTCISRAAEPGGGFFGRRQVDVENRDAGARRGELCSDRAPETAAAAGHDRDSVTHARAPSPVPGFEACQRVTGFSVLARARPTLS
jgi:hypothetical protein